MDKLLAFWRIVEPRIRILIILAFAGMLAGIFAFYKSESPYEAGGQQAVVEGRAAKLDDDRGPADRVNAELYAKIEPIEKSEFAPLIANSMFSVKAVKDQTEREAEANRKYDEALSLAQQGRFDDALRLVNEALQINESHSRARELKQKLETRVK